jgi:hypothetical protein
VLNSSRDPSGFALRMTTKKIKNENKGLSFRDSPLIADKRRI